MDAKEELNQIKRLLLTLRFATAKEQQVSYEIIERVERNRIKQARIDALEEAAKIIDVPFNIGDESIEAKLTKGYVKAIRALKEKE